MNDVKLWNAENKTRNLSLTEKDLGIHQTNHKVIEFEIERELKPGTGGLIGILVK